MPKSITQYADRTLAKEYRNHQRRQNYQKTRQNARNHRKPYTHEECKAILNHNIPDAELSRLIGRSVQAIQSKRNDLKELSQNHDNM